MKITDPGIYADLNAEDYHAPDVAKPLAVGSSDVRSFRELVPARWHYGKTAERDTGLGQGALGLGTLVHALVLEPERSEFVPELDREQMAWGDGYSTDDRMVMRPEQWTDYRTKAAREWRDEVLASGAIPVTPEDWRDHALRLVRQDLEATGQTMVPAAMWDRAQRMADSVMSHPLARRLLEGWKQREVSLFARRPSGLWVKARLDLWDGLSQVGDLKTTSNASKSAFERSVHKFGYADQACHYGQVMRMLGHRLRHWYFVVVESEEPHVAGVYRLEPRDIEEALPQWERTIAEIETCMAHGWTGVPDLGDAPEVIGLPEWARYRRAEENASWDD